MTKEISTVMRRHAWQNSDTIALTGDHLSLAGRGADASVDRKAMSAASNHEQKNMMETRKTKKTRKRELPRA
jgi:hypothetical protein